MKRITQHRFFSARRMLRWATLTWSATLVFTASPPLEASSAPDPGRIGQVRLSLVTAPPFDKYTKEPTAAIGTWLNQHLWRILTFSPYWDAKLAWYSHAWFYQDAYALYANQDVAKQHPDWVLKDASGNRLYIPWGCGKGACPQYAADPGNQEFRAWWIKQAAANYSKGYAGIWVDDVNLEMRVGDGKGKAVPPIDPRTGRPMAKEAWEGYMADFMQQIRDAFPKAEIVHNAIWFAGGASGQVDASIARQIQAADWINLERGIMDGGLQGGAGDWSVNAFLGFIDKVHALGRNVVLEEYGYSAANGDYPLAGYFLVNDGNDSENNNLVTPDTWWNAYGVNLGTALQGRYAWNGLLRRDFTNGMVLLNPPQAQPVTATLPATYINTAGQAVHSVTLAASQGAVLVAQPGR